MGMELYKGDISEVSAHTPMYITFKRTPLPLIIKNSIKTVIFLEEQLVK